ncbi:hypothetical protein FB567DRAFT_589924 [Paraphoma chrysanthemicola]|uniref:PHD-type domain-containing protein n=1 Tax=Paraphoma chrysanthemicola TaxID=798071 RepID=A0A8K0RBU2_9PLEO|nr:hypothetical protein FB567DRAFT_589924 [Paraphoma chrysanthemicola]
MSASTPQPITTNPEGPQLQLSTSAPLTPAKRRVSTSNADLDVKVKAEGETVAIMAPTTFLEQSPPPAVPEYSEHRYGVFEHFGPNEPSIATIHLVCTATNFTAAYDMLRMHAEERIGEYPQWGATSTRSVDNMLEILGFNGVVHMRYQILRVQALGQSVDGRTRWAPLELIKSEEAPDDDAPELYFVDIDLHCQDADKTEHFITGGFRSLAEASNAMKSAAKAYLENHDGARVLERQIEIVDENGVTQQRFSVGPGNYTSNKLMTEEVWRQKQGLDPTHLATPRLSSPVAASPPQTPVHIPVEVPAFALESPDTPRPQVAPKPKAAPKAKAKSTSKAKGKGKGKAKTTKVLYCTCRQSHENGLMVKCDNEDCSIGWYHATCIGMNVDAAPTEEEAWYCPTCVEAGEMEQEAAQNPPLEIATAAGKAKKRRMG